MTTKQKILKEIDDIPDKILQQVYQYLHLLNMKYKKQKVKSKAVYSPQTWEQLSVNEFFEGYGDKDAVYDRL